MTLIIGTPEDDLKQRIADLEEYVLRIEQSRCELAVKVEFLRNGGKEDPWLDKR